MAETKPRSTIQMLKPIAPRHAVSIRHRIGALQIDVDFELTQRWTILFGPSGSGKTTILKAIAGLIKPDHARIISIVCPDTDQERRFTFIDTDARTYLPPHKRVVRMAPQQSALFPHLTVGGNVDYGMTLYRRDSAEERYRRILSLLAKFQISHLADTLPAELSGGEAQRVNMARAVSDGGGNRLLMLDEPFSGIDTPLKDELIASLLERQADMRRGQILSVTHDVAEAFQLGAEVIKIADGKVVAQGPVEIVLAEERARLLQQLNP